MPSPVEAFPCGSRSRTSVGSPTAARAVPRLIAVVVFPTPPFWLATTKTRGLAPFCSCSGTDMAKLPNLQNDARGVGYALVLANLHPPRFTGLGQFSRYRLALEKQRNSIRGAKSSCISQQDVKRGEGTSRDNVEGPVSFVFYPNIPNVYGQLHFPGRMREEFSLFARRFVEGHRSAVPQQCRQDQSREPGTAA